MFKDKRFWIGVAVGVFVFPMVSARVPALAAARSKIPV